MKRFLTQIRLLLHLRPYYLLLLVVVAIVFAFFLHLFGCAQTYNNFHFTLVDVMMLLFDQEKTSNTNEKNGRSQINHEKVIHIRFYCFTTLIHLCGAVNVILISMKFYDRLRLPFNQFNAYFSCSSNTFHFFPATPDLNRVKSKS